MPENKRTYIKALAPCGFTLIGLALSLSAFGERSTLVSENDACIPVPAGAARLTAAYSEQKPRYANNRIVFSGGYAVVYDDGRTKSFEEMLDESDVEDMFSQTYALNGRPACLAALVRVFEKHGFVWGGRWCHYDAMQFECRPEIIGKQVNDKVLGFPL